MALGDEKQAFSKRLREALKRAEPVAAGPAALAREFNLRYEGTPVTVQAVRKWVSGRALPSQDKIRALALWLEVSPQWLRYGDAEPAPARALRQESAAYCAWRASADRPGLLNGGPRVAHHLAPLLVLGAHVAQELLALPRVGFDARLAEFGLELRVLQRLRDFGGELLHD